MSLMAKESGPASATGRDWMAGWSNTTGCEAFSSSSISKSWSLVLPRGHDMDEVVRDVNLLRRGSRPRQEANGAQQRERRAMMRGRQRRWQGRLSCCSGGSCWS